MKTLLPSLKKTLFCAGAVAFLAAPSYCQLTKKILPVFRMAGTKSLAEATVQKIPVSAALAANFGPSVTVYALNTGVNPLAGVPNTQLPPQLPLYPLADTETSAVQNLLHKKIAKPADTFYGLFQQAIYLHHKNSAVLKQIGPEYYHEMNVLMQHAATVVAQQGYPAVLSYLQKNKGFFPSLNEQGALQASEQASQMLVFYASEEMGSLLEKLLARPVEKQNITDEEWIAVNALSTFFPAQTRPVFYDLLLDKKYKELQILSLDPYMRNADTRRIAQGVADTSRLQAPSLAKRISDREKRLQYLTEKKDNLPAIITHKKQQYTKNKVIYDILSNEGNTQGAAAAKNSMEKDQRAYMQAQAQLRDLSAQINQINAELDFLRTK